jgi:hypothetical protein
MAWESGLTDVDVRYGFNGLEGRGTKAAVEMKRPFWSLQAKRFGCLNNSLDRSQKKYISSMK